MIDVTHLRAHRTAARLLKTGRFPDASPTPSAVCLPDQASSSTSQ